MQKYNFSLNFLQFISKIAFFHQIFVCHIICETILSFLLIFVHKKEAGYFFKYLFT